MKELNKFIKSREKEWDNFKFQNNHILLKGIPKPIKIFISSNGGDLHAILPIIDLINSLKGKIQINTYVEGVAASAASLLASVGHKRFITRNSFLLIHELRTQAKGTYSNFKDENVHM